MLNLLTETDVAERLRVSLASVRRWRLEKRGPTFVKVGTCVRYRPEDLESWITSLPTNGPQHLKRSRGDDGELTSEYSASVSAP
jgi:hypothetical protein